MDDEEFRPIIVKVIGAVVDQPELKKLAGSGKVFAFGTIDGDVSWYIDCSGDPIFSEGTPEKFEVRAKMLKADWLSMLSGKLSPTQAMLRKKLKVEGSIAAITSLSMDALLRTYKEQMEDQTA
ncbi:MAG: sterol transfer family [Actinomycetota bacterium]|jgi:putative sterol carrier protein|nr:sterol transfer family [Actinomycetota bacterium]MDQ1506560.1 sterol transfer family [Actinomycetota bacterium]